MIRMIRTSVLLLTGVALTACVLDIAGPQPVTDGLPEGLRVELTVEPGEVAQHEAFSVHLSVTNTTSHIIEVVTAHGCLAIPHVRRNGERIPFQGSWWGCTAAITTHTFAPGETWSRTWEMRAELYAEHPGEVDGVPAPKGTYHVQAEFDTLPVSESSRKPVVERTLRVR
jgi:hypothetical protein